MLLADGRTLQTPVVALEAPVEDLGAGDVYAAALFVALAEGREPYDAAAFAGAAAAVRMMGRGVGAIGDRAAIERRLSGRAP
jgi:sugar/nucleoside kinase (ribokinase family)